MAVAVNAPRGGVVENIGGQPRVLVLTMAGIERFEDSHRAVFDLWDGFFARGTKPNTSELRDLIALGLIGGGMDDVAADKLLAQQGPDQMLALYKVASGMLGAAFLPDLGEEVEAPPASGAGKKKV